MSSDWQEMNFRHQAEVQLAIRELECRHENKTVRRRVVRGGALQLVSQCVRCGEAVGSPIAAKALQQDIASLESWDDDLKEQFRAAREQQFEALKKQHREQRRGLYDGYLGSAQWKALRAKVLKRAQGMCEGCASAPATEVHHLTYARWGREMLFDLVAICEACHDAVHDSDSREGGKP